MPLSYLEHGDLALQPLLLVRGDALLVEPLAEALALEALCGLQRSEDFILVLVELLEEAGLGVALPFRHGDRWSASAFSADNLINRWAFPCRMAYKKLVCVRVD